MAREFLEKSLEDFLKDFVGVEEALFSKFEKGLKDFVATRSKSVKMKDILHLLTKEELLKIGLDTFEIDIFLKRLDKKRRKYSAGKIFNDPIHGSMEIHPACVLIIDTPQFQRLRYIKQLGMCYFVFPGASHNRFEHSIGTCYLAGQFCRSLRENQPELGITDMDILCVEIAGLCHDLGHGPFSRLFVDRFLPSFAKENDQSQKEDAKKDQSQKEDAKKGQSQKEYARKHKVPSADMFDFLLRENVAVKHDLATKYDIGEKELTFIKEQIDGPPVTGSTLLLADARAALKLLTDVEFTALKSIIQKKNDTKAWPYEGRKEHKAYLYEIVSNLRNGIDVCKWDYLARDCHHLGLRNNFDHRRYMKFARVIEESGEHQICLRDKEAGNVYNMFYTRYTLNKYAYKHPANCAIEEMVVDVLKEVKDNLSFGEQETVDVLKKSEEHLTIANKWLVDVVKNSEENLKIAYEWLVDVVKKPEEYITIANKLLDDVKKCEEYLKIAKEGLDDVKKCEEHIKIANQWLVDVVKKSEEYLKNANKWMVQVIQNAKRDDNLASASVVDSLEKTRRDSTDALAKVVNILTKTKEDFKLASDTVVDILKQAQEGLNPGKKGLSMSECHKDGGRDGMRALSELTDDVLYKIRYDRNPNLKESKKILQRIYERQLYTCVYKSDPLDLSIFKKIPNVQTIKERTIKEDSSLQDDDNSIFFVQIVHLDFGMKEENPVRRLSVFGKGMDNLYEARHLPDNEVSRILCPPNHNEQEIRFYSKNTDDDIKKKVKSAAEKCIQKYKDEIEEEKKKEKEKTNTRERIVKELEQEQKEQLQRHQKKFKAKKAKLRKKKMKK